MGYGYTYKRDSGGRHIQFEVNAMNPGAFNILARNLERMGQQLGSPEACSAASRVIAEDVAEEVMKVVRRYGADKDLDGHRITSVLPYKSKGGLYGVVMKSPHKQNSEFPDAYYLEYGYGIRANEFGGRQHTANKSLKKAGRAARGYEPGKGFKKGVTMGDHHRDYTDKNTGQRRQGWFYYDWWRGGLKRFSTGLQGIAAMYRGRLATSKKLRDPASGLRKRIAEAVSDVMTRGVR